MNEIFSKPSSTAEISTKPSTPEQSLIKFSGPIIKWTRKALKQTDKDKKIEDDTQGIW